MNTIRIGGRARKATLRQDMFKSWEAQVDHELALAQYASVHGAEDVASMALARLAQLLEIADMEAANAS